MKAKYILTAHDRSDAISVYTDTDLERRLAAAKDLGVQVTVRRINEDEG